MQGRRAALLTASLVALALAHAGFAAWNQYWTLDERIHLEWSERLLDTGEAERASRQRFESKTPAMLPHVLAARAAGALGVESERALRLAARLPSVAILALLIGALFAWVRELAGRTPALVAAAAAALDPNLVAHGSLATVDAPYALATLLTLWAAARAARRPTILRGALAGVAAGAALATKFTALLLVAGLLALPLFIPVRPMRRLLAPVLAAVAAAWFVLGAAYLFNGLGAPVGELLVESSLARVAALAPALPSPVPAPFLTGLDLTMSTAARPGYLNPVLLGRHYPDGVWYYFAVCWVLKTPLLLLLALLAGVVEGVRGRVLRPAGEWGFMAFHLALALVYFSFFFRVQIGLRFVLMCVPLLIALAAPGLARLLSRPAGPWLALAVVAVSIGEHLPYVGNPLSFTNLAVQPKREAFRLVADSNISWGQNRDKIEGWLKTLPPGARTNPPHVLPGLNVFELNELAGVYAFEQHRWIREHASPRGHLGHTYLWFDVSNRMYDRFLDEERRYAPGPVSEELCAGRDGFTDYPPRSRVPFARTDPPEPGAKRRSTACVRTKLGATLGFRLEAGLAEVGHADPECAPLLLKEPGEVVWFSLEPGLHALCVVERPNRRAWLPYEMRGVFVVRGHSLSLALPETPPPERGVVE